MFEIICMFFFFYPLYKWSEKRKPTIKQEKVQNDYCITKLYSSKRHVNSSLLFDQFISNIQKIIDIEWLYELISMFYISLFIYLFILLVFLSLQIIRKKGYNSKTGESSKL